MWEIARATLRQRKGGFIGVFIAVLCGSALITALGVLFESGMRTGVPPQRYAGATVIVGGEQTYPLGEDVDPHYAERVPLPADTVDKIARVSDVERAVGDVSVAAVLAGRPVSGHNWSSAVLTPFAVREGREPSGPGEVVLAADLARQAGIRAGDRIEIAVGTAPSSYTVAGIASPTTGSDVGRESVLFFTDEVARTLSGRPDQVDTVGVLGHAGVDADALAERIAAAVPGVATYTGKDRGDVEFLDVGAARAELLLLTLSFSGTTIIIAMLVLASTLALSIQQRRREVALLRAVGATRRQIHRLIGAEVLLVGGVAAVLGAPGGIALAYLLHSGFVRGGLLPADFDLVPGPLPAVVAAVLCIATARIAGWVAARRPARINPVEALGEASVQPRSLHWFRILAGCVAALAGLAASVLPAMLPGETAVAGAAGSAILLVLSVALLGPGLVAAAVRLIGAPLRRFSPVSGYLAAANARAATRRLAGAVTPLVLAITIAAVQIFNQTTVDAAAQEQARDGVVADFVVSGTASGLGREVTEDVRQIDGTEVVSPVVRSQVFAPYMEADSPQVQSYAAQGVEPGGLHRVLDLEPRSGDLARLQGETVALSQMAAETLGVEVGQAIDLHLGDGARIRPTVVATYGRGLGFGDVTLPHELLIAHTTTRLDQSILVRAHGADRDRVGQELRELAGVTVLDRAGLTAAGEAQREGQNWPNLIALAVLLGYIAISVVNTLVMATAQRVREFALLRLVGTERRQVVRMMRVESLIVVGVAAVIGSLIAIPPLAGISVGMTESWLPSISLPVFAGIIGVTALLGLLAIGVPTRVALRARPIDAIGIRE